MNDASDRLERRAVPRRPQLPDESWVGGLDAAADSLMADSGWADVHEPFAPSAEDERSFWVRHAGHMMGAGQTAFQRIYRAFIAARAALGVALLITLGVGGFFRAHSSSAAFAISALYAALAASMWVLPRLWPHAPTISLPHLRSLPWLATIGVDVACFMTLHALSPVSTLNFVPLLVLPVLMAGVLTRRLIALGTVSAVTLLLLVVAGLRSVGEGEITLLMTQAGLASSGFFVITLLAGELAARLAREELSAKGSLELARQQAQLNLLVIEEMQEGVLVVDRRGRVRTANPAARKLLVSEANAEEAPFQLRGVEAWSALVKSVELAFAEGQWPEAGRDVMLKFDGGLTRTLRVRVRFTRRREPKAHEDLCVLFIEDIRSMQARTRQEKLAAMGRVSAGIAHEIRNPLAAISQANALMAEDATNASQRQLTLMVAENVERLKRIVDDVMEVAPGEARRPGVIDAAALVASTCSEWARTADLPVGEQSLLQVDLPQQSMNVIFDAEHLRRVLINLLDNARRHASGSPGAVQVKLVVNDELRAVLSVLSDGSPIPPDVERYLFEPFFSTRSRGAGLGLYICRELCERYGARIDYRLRDAADTNRNEFFVAMRRERLFVTGVSDALLPANP